MGKGKGKRRRIQKPIKIRVKDVPKDKLGPLYEAIRNGVYRGKTLTEEGITKLKVNIAEIENKLKYEKEINTCC